MGEFLKLFGLFFRVGSTNFGGPAIIPYLRAEVLKRGIIDARRYGRGVALTEILPGSTILQLSGFIGQEYKGVSGAVVAFAGMAMPSFLMMLGLTWLYVAYHSLEIVKAVLACMDAVIIVVILQAARMSFAATIKNWRAAALAAIGFALFMFKISSLIVLGGCAVLALFVLPEPKALDAGEDVEKFPTHLIVKIVVLCLVMAGVTVGAFLWEPRMGQLAVYMVKASLLAFGGGFATIPIFLEDIVHTSHWLTETQLMAGIMLGQVTPGPVVITATFIGYLLHGLLGACLATLCILGPSFILVVAIGPVFGSVGGNPWVRKGVTGVLAGFIGMLGSVAIFLGREVHWNWPTGVTLGLAALLMLWKKPSVIWLILMGVAIAVGDFYLLR
ncbi:chromate transporter, chromate ion transporter (CHR) family [Solidesulfovibrio fructosivorans JJ]]|uniref:Chromate transporter, chromate ion transporter (CHR) family n=1 Tax=Solidesulfovibrio fructosivorans JJ] TaxID=596151 RepID=E1JY66_SOLFR|nr:chromate efflux transporter [Solidesulfovibrio fructosivorans]EFL50640.1 chromate transporter, chromate ion transporter (CHR) family [Solidesulfovibrio fructosivorans JJ]]